MPALQKEKQELEESLGNENDYEVLQKTAGRISEIIATLDEKEMRWLELSEKVSG